MPYLLILKSKGIWKIKYQRIYFSLFSNLKQAKLPCFTLYSLPPIGVLWLVVLTVPAGQVAEETIIEEEEEEAEKSPLTKKPRVEEMTNSVEESQVMFLAMWRKEGKELKPKTFKAWTFSIFLCILWITVIRNSYLVVTWFTFTGRHWKRTTTAAASGGQSKSPGVPTPAPKERAGGRTVPPQTGGYGPTTAQWSWVHHGWRGGWGRRCSSHRGGDGSAWGRRDHRASHWSFHGSCFILMYKGHNLDCVHLFLLFTRKYRGQTLYKN